VTNLPDDDLVAAFQGGMLSPTAFHHPDHLRLTRCLIRQLGTPKATGMITDDFRSFAIQHGHADKYREPPAKDTCRRHDASVSAALSASVQGIFK
jgi:hypothetical protein